ncbi:unnamed protein product [Ectocarpus fasciculatus]
MAGPRSISRSTKVVATGGAGKQAKGKNKHQKRGKKKVPPQASWDHDNSSAAESDDEEPTPAGAGKKRPRDGSVDRDGAQTQVPDDGRASARKTSGGASSKRQRAAGREASGGGDEERSSGSSSDDDGENGGAGEGDGGRKGRNTPAVTTGGMGDVMARILGQKLDTRVQAPVLAKRKTKTMKEMENASVKRAETRGKSAARRANMTQQFVIPDHTTTDYERQLKKIATRGVVALFNAISKRQNQGGASSGGGSSNGNNVAATAKATAVKGASRHAFLDMLKTGVKPTGGAADAAAGGGVGSGGKRGGGSAGGGGGAAGADGGDEDGGRSWSVLKEDYMMGASTMKNWDQDSADSEIDAIGGPSNDMSDEDSD